MQRKSPIVDVLNVFVSNISGIVVILSLPDFCAESETLAGRIGSNDSVAERANEILDAFTKSDGMLGQGGRALLFAATTLSWAYYEGLCADLWVTALNCCPDLVHDAARARPQKQESKQQGDPGKQISIELLKEYKFDVRAHMGTILKSKYTFRKIASTRYAYEAAFGASQVFSKAFDLPDLKLLEATRHLIVHRGGQVDQKFNVDSGLNLPLGSNIALDADTVTRYLDATMVSGIILAGFVDGHLKKNTKP
jgi:hypothetical protein